MLFKKCGISFLFFLIHISHLSSAPPDPEGLFYLYLHQPHSFSENLEERANSFYYDVLEKADKAGEEALKFLNDEKNPFVEARNELVKEAARSVFPEMAMTPLPHKLHFVWRGNPLPDRYILEILSYGSEILANEKERLPWSLHLWIDDPRILNKWSVQVDQSAVTRFTEYFNASEQSDLRNYFTDLLKEKKFTRSEYMLKMFFESVFAKDPRKEGGFLVQAQGSHDFLKEHFADNASTQKHALDLKKAFNVYFVRDAYLSSREAKILQKIWLKNGTIYIACHPQMKIQPIVKIKDHPLEEKIFTLFKLFQDVPQKVTQPMPEEISTHLTRLQGAKNKVGEPILNIHLLPDFYKELEKKLPKKLSMAISDIHQFEGGGINPNYAAKSDIDRKVILREKGGIYSDLDGVSLAPLTNESPSIKDGSILLPPGNNDPYFSSPNCRTLWNAILYDIAARYCFAASKELLNWSKRNKGGTIELTGPGTVCIGGAHQPFDKIPTVFDRVLEASFRSDLKLSHTHYFMAKTEITPTAHNINLGIQYIVKEGPFKRAVMFDGTWSGSIKQAKGQSLEA